MAAPFPKGSSISGDVRPTPTDEETVAIAAAVELLWPRPGGVVPTDPTPAWRFSGRWWAKPVAARRKRPW
jgi:hypothetical protein